MAVVSTESAELESVKPAFASLVACVTRSTAPAVSPVAEIAL